jgi:hypothetical protein
VVLLIESLLLLVGQCVNERLSVQLIGYGHMGVARHVHPIELVVESPPFLLRQPEINRDDSNASLLQELHMRFWNITQGLSAIYVAD